MRADLESLEDAIGYHFANRDILIRALTHSSHAHERALAGETIADNEQLEFLGDSVLGFLVSEALFKTLPECREGRLSTIKGHVVSAVHLHEVARPLELGSYLRLSHGEERTGGRTKRTLLGNAMEALIAAIYLDGGIEAARAFVSRFVLVEGSYPDGASAALLSSVADFRSALQELTQARRLPPPQYILVNERGPGHSKTFTMEVRVGHEWVSRAEGYTKKVAAQKAAREIYEKLAAAE